MPVTRDEVVWAYRMFLGRNPESEAAIEGHMQAENIDAMRRGFMSSVEFSARLSEVIGFYGPPLPIDMPGIEVDTEADASELSGCVERIREAWTLLGTTRPHWSVLTDKRYLPENIEGSIGKFWASGELEAQRLDRVLARHDYDKVAARTCVEFGCGVGRVTIPLGRRFAWVYAYDISPGHLELAGEHAVEEAVNNVSFIQCSETLLDPLLRCDVFYSQLVFQHNPPPIIFVLVKNALRALKPAGIAIFQVPTYIDGYRFKTAEWLNADHRLRMETHCLPQRHIFEIAAQEDCKVLEIREDKRAGTLEKFVSNTFVICKNR
ncbi:MAG TPA: class I SAM-dependent methyltransferase [Syntrophobacteraceae bacterium]|nr:class I SAM-dependent methyltransferase [Syntrophobacteraceae bacterium]